MLTRYRRWRDARRIRLAIDPLIMRLHGDPYDRWGSPMDSVWPGFTGLDGGKSADMLTIEAWLWKLRGDQGLSEHLLEARDHPERFPTMAQERRGTAGKYACPWCGSAEWDDRSPTVVTGTDLVVECQHPWHSDRLFMFAERGTGCAACGRTGMVISEESGNSLPCPKCSMDMYDLIAAERTLRSVHQLASLLDVLAAHRPELPAAVALALLRVERVRATKIA